MGSKREDAAAEFLDAIEGVAEDVLKETLNREPSSDEKHRFIEALGRSLKTRGLKLAHLDVMPGEVR
jgi:hypothetical protein